MRSSRAGLLPAIAAACAACARDPLQVTCPAVAAGGLAVSEIRGKQSSSSDALGQWIEIYNTTGAAVKLTGLAVEMTTLTGASTVRFEVRAQDAEIGPNRYFVMGKFPAAATPAYVDYGFGDGFAGDLPSGAGLDLVACSTTIDHVTYRTLPGQGTLSYDGMLTPDAIGNDDESAWCADVSNAGAGTPKMRNTPCAH